MKVTIDKSILAGALKYAMQGIKVIPVNGKAPYTPSGSYDGSDNPDQINKWWADNPSANVAISTGDVNHIICIDVDVDETENEDGREVLRSWEAEHGRLPETWCDITPRGGTHIFYQTTEKYCSYASCSDAKADDGKPLGIDIRWNGTCAVVAPSIHPNGRRYEWDFAPDEVPIAEVNENVDAFIRFVYAHKKNAVNSQDNGQRFELPDKIPKGMRTSTMFQATCSMISKGYLEPTVRAAVKMENEARCDPPLTDKELEKEVFTAFRRNYEPSAPYTAVCDNGAARPLEIKEPVQFDLISAKELQGLDIPPLEYIVDDFLSVGLSLMGAPPKSYKSYMCLYMCLCICRGYDFMGFKTQKCGCLYLDLESTRRRPRDRINQILQGEAAPENFYIVTKSAPMGKGFAESIKETVKNHPDIKVVVVDVFKKIRPPKKANADPYERDYEDYGAIKELADALGLAIILVTHTTKMKHPDDPFNELSGSAGTLGSVDAAMVIKKDNRDDDTAKLYITGRDIEDNCYEMQFNKNSYRWEMLGLHRDMELMRKECEYRNSHIIKTIKKLVEQFGGGWTGTTSEIIDASKYYKGMEIYDAPAEVGKHIRYFSKWLFECDAIEMHEKRSGKDRKMEFVYKDPFVAVESEEIPFDAVIPVTAVTPVTPVIPVTEGEGVTEESQK